MYRTHHADLCASASPPVLRGHRVTVASHECGKDWIDKVQGARFVSLGKSPLAGDARRAKFKQVSSVRRWVGCGRVWVDGVEIWVQCSVCGKTETEQ